MPHTIYTDDLIETTMDINEAIVVLEGLIRHDLEKENCFQDDTFCLFLELFALNRTIKKYLEKNFDVPVFKDEEQKEILVSKETLGILFSLLVARKSLMDEANSFSRSVRLN